VLPSTSCEAAGTKGLLMSSFLMLLKSKLSQIFSHGETENKEKFKLLFHALEIKTVSTLKYSALVNSENKGKFKLLFDALDIKTKMEYSAICKHKYNNSELLNKGIHTLNLSTNVYNIQ